MNKRLIIITSLILILSMMIGCTKQEEKPPLEDLDDKVKVENMDKHIEKVMFDEEIVIVNEGDIKVIIEGKSKNTPGDATGYLYKVSNMTDNNIYYYVKDLLIDGVEYKTDMDENIKMPATSLTQVSTQMTIFDINSLDELKNASGVFCILNNDNSVDEYEFEIK